MWSLFGGVIMCVVSVWGCNMCVVSVGVILCGLCLGECNVCVCL